MPSRSSKKRNQKLEELYWKSLQIAEVKCSVDLSAIQNYAEVENSLKRLLVEIEKNLKKF